MQQIILASASPRRESLLKQICLDFQVIPSCVEEVVDPGCVPQETAVQLANLKAHSVSRLYPEAIVLGADTAVCCEGRVLGKPRDIRDAYQMLKFLSGRTHQVVSGVVLCQESRKLIRGEAVTTGVRFRDLTDEEIAGYVATGEPMDKAGAYGIQGLGALLVEGIQGCYFNVVGLPLSKLPEMFREFGVDLLCRRLNMASP
ncbi:Maf family protein [Syntrophaceticus schinkii]|jgi:septum formation protein|uniref:dTTP/UTP pyrophosphatase n=1 Tax=Syntrophaceticus schinkii TaxID=499207 RepID=A0A0B7MFG4_9FIRM|nr:Maf family protein [Syntrophaceticus schinkii]CEO89339.1 putative septum formation protein [Syntrophaceticus schinkii]